MSKDPFTKETDTRFTLRINTELLEQVKKEAETEKRSTAKQIELILEKHFENKTKE